MKRDKEAFAPAVELFIEQSGRSQRQIALNGYMTPVVLCKICKGDRGATEAQVIGIALGGVCDKNELRLLHDFMNDRETGASWALRALLRLHETTLEQVALETCISIKTLQNFLTHTFIPARDEAMRIAAVAIVRDRRRATINALLELAGYYRLLPPLPPLHRAA